MLPYKSSSHSASTAVTDSLDFRVADAPLQIQFASAKCVRCAPQGRYHNLRAAGPSNLRTLRTLSPLWCLRHHLPAPLGSVSLDSQSPTVPCESSSLATTSGGTKNCREPSEPVGRRAPHLCKADFLDKSPFFLYNGSRCGDTMSIENIVEKGELLDKYGALLTDRQRDCLDLYYNENLTLAEIAEHFHISRQAVHDAMRHGEEQLMTYESALHLVSMRGDKERAARELMELIPDQYHTRARILIDCLWD